IRPLMNIEDHLEIEQGNEAERGGQLDDEIANGKGGAAGAAAAAQPEIAHERQIVVPADALIAIAAARARPEHALFDRQARNGYVEKAAEEGAADNNHQQQIVEKHAA